MSHNHYISQGQRQRRNDDYPDFLKKSVDVGKARSESTPARNVNLDNSKKRKHRIFQDSLGLFQSDQPQSQKRNRSCIFPKKTPDKNQVKKDSATAVNISLHDLAKVQEVVQTPKQEPAVQISIQAKRLSLELRKKQQEVQYLKLEIERYRRCDKLSRENESLYKKLSQKLQDTPPNNKKIDASQRSKNSGIKNAFLNKANRSPVKIIENFKDKKRQNSKQHNSNAGSTRKQQIGHFKEKEITPIHSLQDIKFTSQRQSSNKKYRQTDKQATFLKNAFSVDPISEAPEMYKTSPQPIVSHSPNQQSGKASQTLTFNHRSHSKRKQEDIDIQSNLQKIQDKFYSTRRLGRTTMGDIPINRRLQQMNRLLEGNSRYKPSSQHGTASKTRHEPKSPSHHL